MRHIAIIGMSFCGSTALSYILGALPNVASIGESHWINTPPLPGSGPNLCVHCGNDCALLTSEFFVEMRQDHSNWYQKIANRLKTKILISSDKSLDTIKNLDPESSFDSIILFRHPIESWRSYARSANHEDKLYPLEMEEYMWFWSNFYGYHKYNIKNKGKVMWMDWGDFCCNPIASLRQICATLDLTFSSDALNYWKVPHHSLGGNYSPWDRLSTHGKPGVQIAPRPCPEFSPHEKVIYFSHCSAPYLYRAAKNWAGMEGSSFITSLK